MNNGGTLVFSIQGFWTLEEGPLKEDGTPNVKCVRGYKLRLVLGGHRILFEETLDRNKVPVEPTQYLVRRVGEILAPFFPQIDPGIK